MQKRIPLIVIAGATGVGKTELSVQLAKRVGGQIISADSMQVYRGFDIGTAKVKPEETEGVPHYLIDEYDWNEEFNIYEFKRRAKECIEKIVSEGGVPVIAGGTGFYIQSVAYDVDFEEEGPDKTYRAELEALAAKEGAGHLHEMLAEVDPVSAKAIHPNNVKRVIRALEFFHETGGAISEHNSLQRTKESPYDLKYIVLNRERKIVYERINRRVDLMIEEGLEAEVRGLLAKGVSADCAPMHGLGYKEMNEYIAGACTLDEAIYNIKLNTRHFAKRQLTWFRREKDAVWLNYEDFDGVGAMIDAIIES